MPNTLPFFRHNQHVTGLMAPVPEPVRYPFHDDDACEIGQQLKSSGEWQYYEPSRREETRPRCPRCVELGRRPDNPPVY